ncbi:unnamed protein product, partial [Symbiodinium necroappetens]
ALELDFDAQGVLCFVDLAVNFTPCKGGWPVMKLLPGAAEEGRKLSSTAEMRPRGRFMNWSGRFSSEDEDEKAWWEQVRDDDVQAAQQEDMEAGQRSPFSWSHDQPEDSISFPDGIAWDQDLEGVSEPAAVAAPADDGGDANSSAAEGASSSSESDGSGAGPRCQPIEGSDDLFESLKQNGVQSLRQLAFAIGSPQVPPTEEALKELTGKLYGCSEAVPPTVGQIANIRMLIFEASTLVVAQLRAQATADDTDLTGRKLPHVEKQ